MASFPVGLSFRQAQRQFVISTSARPVCHFDKRKAGLSFRRAQGRFVISTSAKPVCHFDKRSEEKSSHLPQVSRYARNDRPTLETTGSPLPSLRVAPVGYFSQREAGLSFRQAQRQFVISTSAARRNLRHAVKISRYARNDRPTLETTGSPLPSLRVAPVGHFSQREAGLSFRQAQGRFVISTSAARRNLLIFLRFLAALETTGRHSK